MRAQKPLHTDAFTLRFVYRKNLLRTDAFYVPVRAPGLRRTLQTRNFTPVFADRLLFCAKRWRRTGQNHNFISVFLPIDFHVVRRGWVGHFKGAILFQFFTARSCFMQKGCRNSQSSGLGRKICIWFGKNTPVLDYLGTMLGVDGAYVGPVLIHVRVLEALLGPNSSHVEFILSQERVFLLSLHPTFVRPTRNPFFPHIDVWGFCF